MLFIAHRLIHMGDRRDSVAASIEETGSDLNSRQDAQKRKARHQGRAGKVFALDYGRLMGVPCCSAGWAQE
jgi:hypothetical protein